MKGKDEGKIKSNTFTLIIKRISNQAHSDSPMIVKNPALIHKALFFSKITKSMRAMRAIYENIVSDKERKYQAVAWPAMNYE